MKFNKTFVILNIFVIVSQIILLRPIVGQGMNHDEYIILFLAKINKDKIFSDPINTWVELGPHNASHIFYISILDSFFGQNITYYLFLAIAIKVLATLSLYPILLILFKRKLLAFLGTALYGVNYSSAGSLSLYVVSNEYLGLLLMNLSLLAYILYIRKKKYLLLAFASLALALGYLVSPIRIHSIFAIFVLVELILVIKNNFSNIFSCLVRLATIFFPIILITLPGLREISNDPYGISGMPHFLKLISDGNWFLILNPLIGLGYLFLPADYFHFFGTIEVAKFSGYMNSIFHLPIMIFGILTVIISDILAKNHLRFILVSMLAFLILTVLFFILYSHHFAISPNLRVGYDQAIFSYWVYAGMIGNFILSISIASGIEWYLQNRKNDLLFLIFIAPLFSQIFIIGQWIFTREAYMYQGAGDRYFVYAAMGVSLFFAGLMTAIYQIKGINRFLAALIVVLMFIFNFSINQNQIAKDYNGKKASNGDLYLQESLHSQAIAYIPKKKIKEDSLFYIKFASNKPEAENFWEGAFDWRNLTLWMHLDKSYLTNQEIEGCVGMVWDEVELQRIATMYEASKGFLYHDGDRVEMRCIHNGEIQKPSSKFIRLDNLYGFAISDKRVINITDEIVKDLSFNKKIEPVF